MRRSAGRISPPGRRALSSGDRLAQCGAVANHSGFLRRPAILQVKQGRQRMYLVRPYSPADGTTRRAVMDAILDGNAEARVKR